MVRVNNSGTRVTQLTSLFCRCRPSDLLKLFSNPPISSGLTKVATPPPALLLCSLGRSGRPIDLTDDALDLEPAWKWGSSRSNSSSSSKGEVRLEVFSGVCKADEGE